MKFRFCSITLTVMVGSLVLAASANAEIVISLRAGRFLSRAIVSKGTPSS